MNQRGVSESTQWAVLTPVLLLLVLGLVQLGVWLHARSVASQVASVVADLRSFDAPDAVATGTRIARAGGLEDLRIETEATGHLVTVTVTARAPLFFDVGQGVIVEKAVTPHEVIR